MDIDELKHTWHSVDRHLEKQQLTDPDRLTRLIDAFRQSTEDRLRRIAYVQRLSMITGLLALALLAVVASVLIMKGMTGHVVLTACAIASLTWGLWWDNKIHRLIKGIRIDTMPVAKVIERMAVLYRHTKWEVRIASIWTVAFTALFYYVMDYWHLPFLHQAVLVIVLALLDGGIIYLLYKKLIYKHIDKIRESEEELKSQGLA